MIQVFLFIFSCALKLVPQQNSWTYISFQVYTDPAYSER